MPTVELDRVEETGLGFLADELTARLADHIERELLLMKLALGPEAAEEDFAEIRELAFPCLRRLSALVEAGQIDPRQPVRLRPEEPEPAAAARPRPLRLGVFPTAGNPLHWAHLLGGLLAISQFRLDKVVYLVAGSDPRKPDLLPASVRHAMARRVLEPFSPFLAYTPVSVESSLPGEVAMFRLLQLNARRNLEAFYLAGSDHCRPLNAAAGDMDTLERLEDSVVRKVFGFDDQRHSLSVIFLDRGGPRHRFDTFLPVYGISRLPLNVSSTLIREALLGRWPRRVLTGLPFTAFAAISALGVYGTATRGTGG